MKNDTFKSNVLKKLIELPLETSAGLSLLASKSGMATKPYIEYVLIMHEVLKNKKSKKKSSSTKTIK